MRHPCRSAASTTADTARWFARPQIILAALLHGRLRRAVMLVSGIAHSSLRKALAHIISMSVQNDCETREQRIGHHLTH